MLQVGMRDNNNKNIIYLLFGYFCFRDTRVFLRRGSSRQGAAGDRDEGKAGKRGCGLWRAMDVFLKVNRGVRTQYTLRWKPSPGSRLCHPTFNSQTKPSLPNCLSPRPGTEDKKSWRGCWVVGGNKKVWCGRKELAVETEARQVKEVNVNVRNQRKVENQKQ